jgi:hypothetical protein
MFAAVPLLALPVIVYNLIALTLAGGFRAVDANVRLTDKLFTIHMTSRAEWASAWATCCWPRRWWCCSSSC